MPGYARHIRLGTKSCRSGFGRFEFGVSNSQMRFFALVSLANSIVAIVVAQGVYTEKKKDPVNRAFALTCLVFGAWSFAQFMQRNADSYQVAAFWVRIVALAWPFTTPAFLLFALYFTEQAKILKHRWVWAAIYLPAVLIAITDATTTLITAGARKEWWGFTYANPKDMTYFWLSNTWLLLLFFVSQALFFQYYFTTGNLNKKYQARLMLFSAAVFASAAILSDLILPALNVRIPELATIFIVWMAIFVGYAISKYELFTLSPTEAAQNIITTMNDSLFLLDPKGTIITVNQATLDLLGYEQDELVGRSARKIFADDTLWSQVLARPLLGDWSTHNHETAYRKKDGGLIQVLFSASLIKNRKGALAGIVGVAKDITDRKQAEETIKHMAYHDALTELPNRLMFMSKLKEALPPAGGGQKQALLFLDLDKFKRVNDELGHDIGDLLLKSIGRRLTACVRETDMVARMGGDEFNILLAGIDREEDASQVAEAILTSIAKPFSLEGRRVSVTASIGINTALFSNDNFDDLIIGADIAMRAAKQQGSNNFVFYEPAMHAPIIEQTALEQDLEHALPRGELEVYFQPIVDAGNERIIGAEALLRWNHPQRGMLLPDQWLQLAEDAGLIVPIDMWVLGMACRQSRAWQEAGYGLLMPVNFSARDLRELNLPELVMEVLRENRFDPRMLQIEIMENALLENTKIAANALDRLRKANIGIAVGDFGVGCCSLVYLQRFSVNTIKIARRFIEGIPDNTEHVAIAKVIISVAKSLGIEVIAVGVERRDQVDFLRTLGVDKMQGYFFSPPVPANDFQRLMESDRHGKAA